LSAAVRARAVRSDSSPVVSLAALPDLSELTRASALSGFFDLSAASMAPRITFPRMSEFGNFSRNRSDSARTPSAFPRFA